MSAQRASMRERIEDHPDRPGARRNGMRWVPGLLILVLALFMAFFEQYFLPIRLPPVGERALQAVRAPYDFVFDEERALQDVVKTQLRDFVPVYRHDAETYRQVLARWEAFFNGLEACRQIADTSRKKADGCVSDLFPTETDWDTRSEILRYPHLRRMKGLLATSLEEIMRQGVLSDEDALGLKGGDRLRIRMADRADKVTRLRDQVLDLSGARQVLRDRVDLIDMSPGLRQALAGAFGAMLEPNLFYDSENESLLASIREQTSDKKRILFQRGDLLVKRGDVVTLLDVHKVRDCLAKPRPDPLLVGAGSFLPLLVLTLIFVGLSLRLGWGEREEVHPYLLLFFVLLAVLLIAKVLYLFTNMTGYAIPVAASGIVVALLLDLPAALLTVLLTAVYTTFLATLDMGLFIYYLISGTVFVLCTLRTSRRMRLFFYAWLVGALNVVVLTCIVLLRDAFPNQAMLLNLAPQALLSAPAAWLLAVLLIPLCEKVFGLATADRLRDLADLNHPLLKKLQERAPGTYYHSLSVANVASVVAEVVGADVHLVRAGAYYHDIGKMVEPDYFIENQNNRENPHDSLPATASYEIVKSHVRDGIDLAREYRFPQAVIDLIAEHHGTTVVEAFFSKAQQSQPDVQLNPDYFRYEGPKPRRVESAILMIADVTEAVGRVLTTTNPLEVRRAVHRVIVKKFEDNQFDRCGLTTSLLARAEVAIVQTLLRVLHKRIDYPEKTAPEEEGAEP